MIWPWRRRRREAELDEEVQGHLAMSARDHEARGSSPREAGYAARREFGNPALVKEVTRQMWGGVWLEQTIQDLRLAFRSLGRSPGFLAVAVLALALGLGLSTTMFSVIDAALHPPQPYANGNRLLSLSPRMVTSAAKRITLPELFQLIRERVPSIDAVIPFGIRRDPVVIGGEESERGEYLVSPEWFELVGLRPQIGRAFVPADGDGVAVVSYEVWKAALSGRRDLAGARVTIGDRSYAVVGVLPRHARGGAALLPLIGLASDSVLSTPLLRLREGATTRQASGELNALAALLTVTYSNPRHPWALTVSQWLDPNVPPDEMRSIHLAMVGSALAVLLIACVNLAHLMLARGLARRRELAIRMALGVSRLGVVRVMLAESAVIGVGGLVLGAIATYWGSKLLDGLIPPDVGFLGWIQTRLSWRVFSLGAIAAVGSTVLFGFVPAVRVALNVRITEPLKDEAGTTTGGRGRRYSPLVTLEVALALALLMSGTLLLRSVHRLRGPADFDPETLIDAEVWSGHTVGRAGRDTSLSVAWDQVLATARGVPGVRGVALQGSVATRGGLVTAEMGADSTRAISMQDIPVVSSNFLQVHGLPVLQGRDFAPGDALGDGAAVLSAAAAARLYPKGNAVGRMLKLGAPRSDAPWVRIVGVARTPTAPWAPGRVVTTMGTGADAPPVWLVRSPSKWLTGMLLVRAGTSDPAVRVRLRHALRASPGVTFVSVHPYTWIRDSAIGYFDFLAKVFVALGVVGLALAALGIYGVLAYAVSRRMREFGVRIALGAAPRGLFQVVMHDGLVMLLAGTGIGALLALAAAPLFGSISAGVYPTDAMSLVAAEAILLGVGLAAAVAPARRALRANPLDIIRAV